MKQMWLRRAVSAATLVVVLMIGVSGTQAGPIFACHGIKKPNCRGVFTLFGSDLRYAMSGSTSFAEVDVFTNSGTARKVTWKSIAMTGTIGKDIPIEATLDPLRTSTGTVLSVDNKEFPATATMRFFFRIETQGIVLISDEPAVFEGKIHSIPPGPGDVLRLVSDPVSFHLQEMPGRAVGTLGQSIISFARQSEGEPEPDSARTGPRLPRQPNASGNE